MSALCVQRENIKMEITANHAQTEAHSFCRVLSLEKKYSRLRSLWVCMSERKERQPAAPACWEGKAKLFVSPGSALHNQITKSLNSWGWVRNFRETLAIFHALQKENNKCAHVLWRTDIIHRSARCWGTKPQNVFFIEKMLVDGVHKALLCCSESEAHCGAYRCEIRDESKRERERVSSALPSALARSSSCPINRRAPPQIGRNFWSLKFYQHNRERVCNFGKRRKTVRQYDPFSKRQFIFFENSIPTAKQRIVLLLKLMPLSQEIDF